MFGVGLAGESIPVGSEYAAFQWTDHKPVNDCRNDGYTDDHQKNDAKQAPAVKLSFFFRGARLNRVAVRLICAVFVCAICHSVQFSVDASTSAS